MVFVGTFQVNTLRIYLLSVPKFKPEFIFFFECSLLAGGKLPASTHSWTQWPGSLPPTHADASAFTVCSWSCINSAKEIKKKKIPSKRGGGGKKEMVFEAADIFHSEFFWRLWSGGEKKQEGGEERKEHTRSNVAETGLSLLQLPWPLHPLIISWRPSNTFIRHLAFPGNILIKKKWIGLLLIAAG